MDKWDARFMELAWVISNWASCYQPDRTIGCVIVKRTRIVTTGHPSGTRHEMCYAIHAEQNAIIQAAKLGSSIDGATLYCTHQPCVICAKMIVNAGITRVVYEKGYPDEFSLEILQEAGVQIERSGDSVP